jgi:hypothetical protein
MDLSGRKGCTFCIDAGPDFDWCRVCGRGKPEHADRQKIERMLGEPATPRGAVEEWTIRVCECGFPLGATLAAIRLVTCPDCQRRVVPVEDRTRSVTVYAGAV